MIVANKALSPVFPLQLFDWAEQQLGVKSAPGVTFAPQPCHIQVSRVRFSLVASLT
jgi:hypothetical protein